MSQPNATLEWVKCSERLPEPLEEVIARGPEKDGQRLIFNAWRQPEQGGVPIYWMMFCRIALRDEQVVEWMPIP